METSRQVERADRFQSALARMPDFETWQEEHEILVKESPRIIKIGLHDNFRLVLRRVRRKMARDLSKREYRAAHGLV